VVYNFCRVHNAIRKTPAMAIGLTDHPWNIAELMDAAASAEPQEPEPQPVPSHRSRPCLRRDAQNFALSRAVGPSSDSLRAWQTHKVRCSTLQNRSVLLRHYLSRLRRDIGGEIPHVTDRCH
jgi:hypothetical protein